MNQELLAYADSIIAFWNDPESDDGSLIKKEREAGDRIAVKKRDRHRRLNPPSLGHITRFPKPASDDPILIARD